ncbi:uncharacterized protein LOC134444062 [Engraulis encrasicolus]|uniref:uncharacterized protein LOC134444062 n=1 Tax=Engraulis encrasicolus TaxID=184585 RepID=UPI002FD45FC3
MTQKRRFRKRMESFQARSEEWADNIKLHRNMSHFVDDLEITVEKMKALGLRPVLLYAVHKKGGGYSSKLLCPYNCPPQVTGMLSKIEQLYKLLLDVWTPEGEERRRRKYRRREEQDQGADQAAGKDQAVSVIQQLRSLLSGEKRERAAEPIMQVEMKNMKIFVRKRRHRTRNCGTHPYVETLEGRAVGRRKQEKVGITQIITDALIC